MSAPDTTNVSGRFYPMRFRAWADFTTSHADMFARLETTLGHLALFPSRNSVRDVGLNGSPLMTDETDLRPFLHNTVEKPAALIVTRYPARSNHPELSAFQFRSNSYGEDVRGLGLNAEAQAEEGEAGEGSSSRRPKKRLPPSNQTIGNPDRWGFAMHRREREVSTHILVGEYKAAHKLRAAKLSQPPDENFFALAAREEEEEDVDAREADAAAGTTKTTAKDGRVFVARVLCQAYHYMISSGLEYGYVASGEGLVFLRVPEDDANTLYYFWRVSSTVARPAATCLLSVRHRTLLRVT